MTLALGTWDLLTLELVLTGTYNM